MHVKKPFIWFKMTNLIYGDSTLVPLVRDLFRPFNFASHLPAEMCDSGTPARGYNLCVDLGFKHPVIMQTVEFIKVSIYLVCTLS